VHVFHSAGDHPDQLQADPTPVKLCKEAKGAAVGDRYVIYTPQAHALAAHIFRRIIGMGLTPDKQLTMYLAPAAPTHSNSTDLAASLAAAAEVTDTRQGPATFPVTAPAAGPTTMGPGSVGKKRKLGLFPQPALAVAAAQFTSSSSSSSSSNPSPG
jgi:hypothetical protein